MVKSFLGRVVATAERGKQLVSSPQPKDRVLEKMAGWWVSEWFLAYRMLPGNEGIFALRKKKQRRGSHKKRRMGDGSSKTEVPEQNSKRGGSVNTKKESRRTCLTGSGTCPLSVRGLSVRPKADWGWVLNDPNKGGSKQRLAASHGLLGEQRR